MSGVVPARAPLAFLDLETTGLDPRRHQIWEGAIIKRTWEGEGDSAVAIDREYQFHLPVDLSRADPTSLRLTDFYKRRGSLIGVYEVGRVCRSRWPKLDETVKWDTSSPTDIACTVASVLAGAHIVGNCPWFDTAFLEPWLNSKGQAGTWHYHLICVENLAVGYILGCVKGGIAREGALDVVTPPWNSDDLAGVLGLDLRKYDRHTALGDARWARDTYDVVTREAM